MLKKKHGTELSIFKGFFQTKTIIIKTVKQGEIQGGVWGSGDGGGGGGWGGEGWGGRNVRGTFRDLPSIPSLINNDFHRSD